METWGPFSKSRAYLQTEYWLTLVMANFYECCFGYMKHCSGAEPDAMWQRQGGNQRFGLEGCLDDKPHTQGVKSAGGEGKRNFFHFYSRERGGGKGGKKICPIKKEML